MREKVIIVESYLHRVILPSFQKEEKITFLSPSEIQEALLGKVDQKILFDIYQNEGKKNYFLSKYYAQAALNYKKRDKSESDVEKDIAAIASRTNFHPNPIKAQLLKGKEIYIHPASYSEGLVQLLKDNGYQASVFSYPTIEDESIRFSLVVYPNREREVLECLNAIGLLLTKENDLMAEEIGICCKADYIPHLSYYANLMGIRLSYPNYSFKDTSYAKAAIEMVRNHKIEEVKALEGHNEREREFYSLFKKMIEQYQEDKIQGSEYDEFLSEELRQDLDCSYVDEDGGVKVSSSLSSLTKKKQVFFLGLDSSVPFSIKNADFLSDVKKEAFTYMPLSYEKNEQKKNEIIQLINYFNDKIHCSFFDTICFVDLNHEDRNVSSFVEDKKLFNLVKCDDVIQQERFSKEADEIMFSSLEDNYQGFGEDSVYYRSLKEKFINKHVYHPDNENPHFTFDLDKLILSFTSMANYFKCPYSFLLNKAYGLNDSDNYFNLDKGNVVHKVFENYANQKENDFDVILQEVIEGKKKIRKVSDLSYHDQYYLRRCYDIALKTIPYLDTFFSLSRLTSFDAEKEVSGSMDGIQWMGKIDLVAKDDQNNYVILDYKTGNHEFDYDEAYYGYDFQLVFYNKQIKDEGLNPLGYYYVQPFKDASLRLNEKGDIKPFKFSGVSYCYYSPDEKEAIKFSQNPIIKELGPMENGKSLLNPYMPFPSGNTKFFITWKRIKELDDQLEKNLKEIQQTLKNDHVFPVRSKSLVDKDGEEIKDSSMCKYCRFKDCCYVSEEYTKEIVKVPSMRSKYSIGKENEGDQEDE